MEAKLIKENNGYTLFVDGKVFGDTDGHQLKSITNKLSLKNCQAIELGYDLDELISESNTSHLALFTSDSHELMYDEGYKAGFQKALEILGDKKFSEDDVINIAEYVRVASQSSPSVRTKYLLAEYQSQEKTEWDVIVEMDEEKEFIFDPAMGISQGHYLDKPKLDADECLILKRI